MAKRPLLIFPEPRVADREKSRNKISPPLIHFPNFNEHKDRLTPKFESMLESFITDTPSGIEPEYVLVLETIGKIEDFARAAQAVKGLEWLAEIDSDDIQPDDLYYEKPKITKTLFSKKNGEINRTLSTKIFGVLKNDGFIDENGVLQDRPIEDSKILLRTEFPEYADDIVNLLIETTQESKQHPLKGRLFLSMSNRQAMAELESLWKNWKKPDSDFKHGYTKWREVFKQLKSLRRWDTEDRLKDTGVLQAWEDDLDIKRGTTSPISFEIELWYRNNEEKRKKAQAQIEKLIHDENGRVVAACNIDHIRFHAIKAELPNESIEKVLNHQYTMLFQNNHIMFFRKGQCVVDEQPEGVEGSFEVGHVSGSPVLAIMDGYPLANHQLLENRLIIDDPDGFEDRYAATERKHGTAIASLICHGELDEGGTPLSRPVYFRPIMKPNKDDFHSGQEKIPEDMFFEDLIERSVRRIFEDSDDGPASAPTVKVINLSIGDSSQMFINRLSATSRLLDWLAYRYNVLFCVSAGNIIEDVDLGKKDIELKEMEDKDLVFHTFSHFHRDNRNRRILSPAESINALTVGAIHDDRSHSEYIGIRVDILPSRSLPSPISPHGQGFHSSIKPEIYMPGGRQLYNNYHNTTYQVAQAGKQSPGQKVAAAPANVGEKNRWVYTTGTSNAAALATRGAGFIYEVLDQLKNQDEDNLPDENIAVIIKALLVHSASNGNGGKILHEFFSNRVDSRQLKKTISRYLGYGVPDIQRVLECTAQRATAIGSGIIKKDDKHEFRFPLPPSLNNFATMRRLTITLAWFSPINPGNRKYRNAGLSFTVPKDSLKVDRKEADWQTVKNGTVQHEILEGKRMISFLDGDYLLIPVICREDAGSLDEDIRYGLAVTLEVAEDIDIPLYEEIRNRIKIPVQIED